MLLLSSKSRAKNNKVHEVMCSLLFYVVPCCSPVLRDTAVRKGADSIIQHVEQELCGDQTGDHERSV